MIARAAWPCYPNLDAKSGVKSLFRQLENKSNLNVFRFQLGPQVWLLALPALCQRSINARQRAQHSTSSVAPLVEIDAAHFFKSKFDADRRGCLAIALQYRRVLAQGAGVRKSFGHHRCVDTVATVLTERGRTLHHSNGAVWRGKHAGNRYRFLDTI